MLPDAAADQGLSCFDTEISEKNKWNKAGLPWITNEPPHDKSNKMIYAPSQYSRSAWASAQCDQSLRCALSG